MRKLTKENARIFSIIVLIVVLITLVITTYGLVKTIKSKKSIPTVGIEEMNDETFDDIEGDGEIINIEELDANIVNDEVNSNSSANNNSKNTSDKTYYIKINYGANVVTIYSKDENGQYTVPVKAMVCSTGSGTPRSGTYGIKSRWRWGNLFGGVSGQYCTHIVGNILFHSVPYLKNGDPGSLEYWEYDKLGTSCSMGCIRLTVSDARWIYNNVSNGTLVEFYSSSDPGPLGKPSAQKISGNETCRNWDPTDPSSDNPWKNVIIEDTNNTTNIEVPKEPEQNTTNNTDQNTVINNNQLDNTMNNTVDNTTNELINNTTTNNSVNKTDNNI